MKKRAQSAKRDDGKGQEVYTCTNQEVLNALFIGINSAAYGKGTGNAADPISDSYPVPVVPLENVSDDSSAESDDEILRQHTRIMKQQEFDQMQRDGYIQTQQQREDSSRLNQLDNSSRQNLLESGSLQMQNSQMGGKPMGVESSPGSNTFQGGQPQHSSTFQQQMQQQSTQSQQLSQSNGAFGPLMGQPMGTDDLQNQNYMQNGYEQQAYGGQSNISYQGSFKGGKGSVGSKKARPTSAYPVSGSYLAQINESGESFSQSRFTPNQPRKMYVPHNIETFEKEKLYTETVSLKKQRNESSQQNTLLKQQLKAMELDMRKKDGLVLQLTNEIKVGSSHLNHQQSSAYPFAGVINQSSFLQTPPELHTLQGGANIFHGSRLSKQMQSQHKTQQLIKQNAEFRKRIKELKCDIALKETEVQNMTRTLKFTKLKEYQVELETYGQEIMRLKGMLMQEKVRPRVDPAQYAALQNQLILERQRFQQTAQTTEQQRLDIEKLTQASNASKLKLVRSKVKTKKLTIIKKRLETKVKVLETKVSNGDTENRRSVRNKKGSKQQKCEAGCAGLNGDNEMHDQLQTQLEINQILIDKLDSMGVDVRELIRNEQTIADQDGDAADGKNTRMVVFTFVGPEGLIEGGDNQQFLHPIDFDTVQDVEQIKQILKKELVLDNGIDLVLREKQSGQILEQPEDIHIAVDSGDGILVQFIENGNNEDGVQQANDMANINEEDEKSEYSDEQFEEEEVQKVQTIPRITLDAVKKVFKQIKLLLMIKKVPRTHMVKHLLKGETIDKDEDSGLEQISSKTLITIFERKFNFSNGKATKIARFFIEGQPPSDNPEDAEIEEKDHRADRETLINRFKEHVPDYMLYNSLALESMLSRLQGIMSGKSADFLEDLNLEDEDSNGYLSFEQIQKLWRVGGHPTLDEELTEFLEFLALRASPSLKKVNYEEFCKIFDDSFTLEDSQHDDLTPFDAAEEDADDHDLQVIRENRAAQEIASGQNAQGETSPDQPGNGADEEEPEIESDDLMVYIDEALNKIVSKLPDSKKKTSLNKRLLPLARVTLDQQRDETLLVLQPQIFIQFMVQTLGISFSDKELYCLLHILVRESDANNTSADGPTPDGSQTGGLNPAQQDTAGYILYKDVYTLVRNYLHKEKLMQQSISLGLDYSVLTKVTFDFLLRLKQILNTPNDKNGEGDAEAKNFREIFQKQICTKRLNTDVDVDLIEFDDFIDGLFMKFKIMCPPKDTMEQLKLLLCVQFGLNIKEPSYFLVQKIERVLYDLDYVYVNLVKILRQANHEKNQLETVKRLKQRYDFVARGIQKDKSPVKQASAKVVNVVKPSESSDAVTNPRSKGKPRPMSSKPRKPAENNKKVTVQEADDIVQEEMLNNDEIADDDDFVDGGIMDEDEDLAREERKQQYKRQQTADIGFELPGDDDEDDDDIDDDYEDDIIDEDNEAQPMNQKNKRQDKPASDDIEDDYQFDEDDDEMAQDEVPPIQETKTLVNIDKNAKTNKNRNVARDISDDNYSVEDEIDDQISDNYSV